MQRCRKHISSTINQHATMEEEGFYVGVAPRPYNEDLTQLELKLSSGVGSCSRELRRNGKKGIRLCKEDFRVCCSCSEIITNPLPGYD
jgi:hypothetical protein